MKISWAELCQVSEAEPAQGQAERPRSGEEELLGLLPTGTAGDMRSLGEQAIRVPGAARH